MVSVILENMGEAFLCFLAYIGLIQYIFCRHKKLSSKKDIQDNIALFADKRPFTNVYKYLDAHTIRK